MCKNCVKMKLTVTLYYDADPANYDGATTPEEMAEIDRKNIDGLDMVYDVFGDTDADITIEPTV